MKGSVLKFSLCSCFRSSDFYKRASKLEGYFGILEDGCRLPACLRRAKNFKFSFGGRIFKILAEFLV